MTDDEKQFLAMIIAMVLLDPVQAKNTIQGFVDNGIFLRFVDDLFVLLNSANNGTWDDLENIQNEWLKGASLVAKDEHDRLKNLTPSYGHNEGLISPSGV